MHHKLFAALFAFILFSCDGEDNSSADLTSPDSDTVGLEPISFDDYETVVFQASDGLDIYGNLYEIDQESPVIVLCHQAGFNKFEYEGIAQRLNALGYNCLAIDQRSGGPIANKQNETFNGAMEKEMGVDYLDAIPDINAAVNYASDKYNQDVVLWGSSYSSTLVLWEAMGNKHVKAVVSFSPGDYFPELGSLTDSLTNFDKPFFITCADFEVTETENLLQNVQLSDNQVFFKPTSRGHHGSRALWENQLNGEQYWDAVTEYLSSLK